MKAYNNFLFPEMFIPKPLLTIMHRFYNMEPTINEKILNPADTQNEKSWSEIKKSSRIHTPTFVTYWQTAHLTDGAPYGYISVVRQCPQLMCATWLDASQGTIKVSKHAKDIKKLCIWDEATWERENTHMET